MYELFKSANDIIFYVVAAVVIVGGIFKIRSRNKGGK